MSENGLHFFLNMKRFKIRLLLMAVIAVALLSVLALLILTGESYQEKKPTQKQDTIKEDIPETAEANLKKANQLFLEQNFEEAHGYYNVAALLAILDDDRNIKCRAWKGLADCRFMLMAADTCIVAYEDALALAHDLDYQDVEYEIYTRLKQAYFMKADMENVGQMEQKLDSIESVTKDRTIIINGLRRMANEAMIQRNVKLAENYLLKAERLLDSSLPKEQRIQNKLIVWTDLRNFYLNIQNYDKAKEYNMLCLSAIKEGEGNKMDYISAYYPDAVICM